MDSNEQGQAELRQHSVSALTKIGWLSFCARGIALSVCKDGCFDSGVVPDRSITDNM